MYIKFLPKEKISSHLVFFYDLPVSAILQSCPGKHVSEQPLKIINLAEGNC